MECIESSQVLASKEKSRANKGVGSILKIDLKEQPAIGVSYLSRQTGANGSAGGDGLYDEPSWN